MTSHAVDLWTPADIPDQSGRTAIVTGPTLGGLGFHTARELVLRGARVVLAGRSPARLAEARAALARERPGAEILTQELDLASLAAVREAAAELAGLGPVHLLVNNAGVMATPAHRTSDGIELQLATNHYGPFLLTGLLLPQLVAGGRARAEEGGAAAGARVVTVSSALHRMARSAPVEDPRAARQANPWLVYAQSKLANLLFTYELDRRLRDAQLPVAALAAHPGVARTQLVSNGPMSSRLGRLAPAKDLVGIAMRATTQSPEAGAWPTLMAATAPLPGATYCGPGRFLEIAGPATVVRSSRLSHDRDAQGRLWTMSEQVTGLRYP